MSRNPHRPTPEREQEADFEAWRVGIAWAMVATDNDSYWPSVALRLRWAARHACRRLREQRDSARQAARLYREDMHLAQDRVARLEAQLARVRRVCDASPSATADIIRRELDG